MSDFISFERPIYLLLLLLAPMLLLVARRQGAWQALERRRLWLALGARFALLLSLTLALAGLTFMKEARGLGVVFVLDRSASVERDDMAAAEQFVRTAGESMGRDDRAAVVVFGETALIERDLNDVLQLPTIESRPGANQTDIAQALRLAEATLPADRSRRMVVLSDGEETRGDALRQVLQGGRDQIEVAVVQLSSGSGSEVLLEDVRTPARIERGASFDLQVVARSTVDTPGTLRLFRNNDYLGEIPVELSGDRANLFTFRQAPEEPGLYRYRAVLEVPDGVDSVAQNNEMWATVEVAGTPRVLYVEGKPGEHVHLSRALAGADIELVQVGVADMPATLAEFRDFAAVILSDVPAYQLTVIQHEALRSYVRDLGGGFAMLGGDESFGVGGYFDTPIEEALPVRMDPEDRRNFPTLGMVLAIDRSCSMGGTGRSSKIGMAREAAIATVDLMSPRDEVGVIAFDSAASWTVPYQSVNDGSAAIDGIARIRVGGGTDIYPALRRAYQQLRDSNAAQKHITLLSDGITAEAAFEPLITQGLQDGITMTAIGIGSDSDMLTIERLARWGGGRHYLVTDIDALPRIFTREAMLAYRSFLIEETFRPIPRDSTPILRGIDAANLPALDGHIMTEAKPRAVVPLWAPAEGGEGLGHPLLATWRYGLGKSLAWTSDAKARWSSRWVGTESYTQFWQQAVRWLIAGGQLGTAESFAEVDRGELIVTVDAFDDNGGFRNFLDGTARVVAPDYTVHQLDLRQVAPGRYQGRMPVNQEGSFLVGITLDQEGQTVAQSVAEAVQPYSPEFRPDGDGPAVLAEIARVGGGGQLADPALAFRPPEQLRRIPQSLVSPLLWLSGLLLLVDVAARRLDPFSPRGVVREKPKPVQGFASSRPELVKAWQSAPRAARSAATEQSAADAAYQEVVPAPVAPKPVEPSRQEVYANRLLSARKKARTRNKEDA